jgi:hypothetical protein
MSGFIEASSAFLERRNAARWFQHPFSYFYLYLIWGIPAPLLWIFELTKDFKVTFEGGFKLKVRAILTCTLWFFVAAASTGLVIYGASKKYEWLSAAEFLLHPLWPIHTAVQQKGEREQLKRSLSGIPL